MDHHSRVLRRFRREDATEVSRLYADTTRRINGRDYTPDQIERWARQSDDAAWAERLEAHVTYVVTASGVILGFAELQAPTEIGHVYVHMDHQGEGVGSQLMRALIAQSRAAEVQRLTAAVSSSAKAFFLRHGFVVDAITRAQVCGAEALQYAMSLTLTPSSRV